MKKYLLFTINYCWILLLQCSGCSSGELPVSVLKEQSVSELPFAMDTLTFDRGLGTHFVNLGADDYLAMFRNSNLCLYSLYDTSKNKIYDLKSYLEHAKVVDVYFANSILYLWKHDSKELFLLKLSSDTIKKESLFDLSAILDWNRFYIKYQKGNTFRVFDSTLYLAYGTLQSNTFYLDSTIYLRIALLDSGKTSLQNTIVRTPLSYRNGTVYLYDSYLLRRLNSTLSIFFQSLDSAYSLDPTTAAVLDRNQFYREGSYTPFDRKKESDLAYVRKYIHNAERNEKVLLLKDNYLLIKRLPSKGLSEKATFLLLLIDSGFTLRCRYSLPAWFDPDLAYTNDSDLFLIDKSSKKLYQYDLQGK